MVTIMYYLKIKPGCDKAVIKAWHDFAEEVKDKYGSHGSALFESANDVYLAISRWESRKHWETFWVTKELQLDSLTRLKACLVNPSKPVILKLAFSNIAGLPQDNTHL